MSYTPAYNPDTVPSIPIQRGLIFGANCPISGQEFLNFAPVPHVDAAGTPDGTRNAIDPSIKMQSLVAAQKLHTWGIIVTQDTAGGVHTPRNRSLANRRAIWLSEQ